MFGSGVSVSVFEGFRKLLQLLLRKARGGRGSETGVDNTVQRIRSATGITSLLQNVMVSKQQRKDDVKLKDSQGAASLAISQKNISEYWLQGSAARHQSTLQKYQGRSMAEIAQLHRLFLEAKCANSAPISRSSSKPIAAISLHLQ
eukprot:CAMPEP_0181482458 /NCGR_PEP_ID=MMETSP1110-20121109/44866_1 /TAXON_ID=174948 /ORGANISM="Symbiodinium sp., Strain CCMP421" /LENGTH=145 /DNA_ID=CAMNT_0023608039 /DNA_START=316 /DNA_END=754 /DNA_ORIENTATION=+